MSCGVVAGGGGLVTVLGCQISRKNGYEDVRFNISSNTKVGGCQISRKKKYVTLEMLNGPMLTIHGKTVELLLRTPIL